MTNKQNNKRSKISSRYYIYISLHQPHFNINLPLSLACSLAVNTFLAFKFMKTGRKTNRITGRTHSKECCCFPTRICFSTRTHIQPQPSLYTHSKLYLFKNFGEEKKKKQQQQAISKTLSGFRSARFGARLENVKVVFSLYRFVRGHRTDYGGSKATFFASTIAQSQNV